MATPNTNAPDKDALDQSLNGTTAFQQNLAKSADQFKEINENAKISGKEIDNIVSLSTQLNNLFKDTLTLQTKIGHEYVKISSVHKEINKYAEQSDKLGRSISLNIATLGKSYTNIETQIEKAEAKYIRINQITKELSDKTLSQSELHKKAVALLQHQVQLESMLKDVDVRKIAYLKFQKYLSDEAKKGLEGQIKNIEAFNKNLDIQNGKLGSLAGIMKGISRIPILGNLINSQKVIDSMEEKLTKTGSKWKAFGAGVGSIMGEIGRLLSDPLVIALGLVEAFKSITEWVFRLDKNITTTANTLGITKDATQGIYQDFERISVNSIKLNQNLDSALLSVTNQGNALNELNTQFGTAVKFTEQQIQDQIFLTKQMGLQEDVAKGIMTYSVLTGKSTNDVLKIINKQNDGLLSYRRVIAEVSKISGQLLAQYKNQPELLAKAVVEADKLGISLQQSQKISDSLLNFQSSIQNEMEAELITGKQLNLEKARYLALQGDSAGAAKELIQQVGSLNDYSKLNVIQQQSIAKAMGMTADELTNALREQETLTKLGAKSKDDLVAQFNQLKANNDQRGLAVLQQQILSKENGDMLLKNISQLSLQQRFEESMNKVKDAFATIASGPLIKIMDGIANLVNHAGTLKALLIGAGAAMSFMATRAIVVAAASAFSSSAAIPIIGAGLGALAAVATSAMLYGMLNSSDTKTISDGVVSPDGRIVISTPKGQIIPDKNDHLIATTNPDGLLNGGDSKASTMNSSTQNDNRELVAIMTDMREIMKKGGSVYLDSRHVGTTMALSYNSFA